MHKYIFLFLLSFALLGQGCVSAMNGVVGSGYGPRAANDMAEQMDAQIMQRGNVTLATTPKELLEARQRQLRSTITIMTTVPVNLNNLQLSNALARQISEEMSRWFVTAGYRVKEIRKGKELRFQEKTGEMLLTRDREELARKTATSIAVLTGTYVITPEQVRYSMRLLHTPSNDVLAMGTATVPITPDVPPLLVENTAPVKVEPSVNTRLQ